MSRLLEPLKVKGMLLNNRLVMPPMALGKAEKDGKVSQAILDYYNERTKGGYIGLVFTEHCYITPQGQAGPNQLSIKSDSMIEGLKRLTQIIHSNGSKAAIQISHSGSEASREVTGMEPVGPSPIINPHKGKEIPRELTKQEIKDIVVLFKQAAVRAKEAGFDAVEIHSAHWYFLNQFYSPLTNKRTDEYGGGVQNRIRIHLEVIRAVREAVGDDYPVFLRLGASDYTEGGTTIEDSLIAARAFEQAGIDLLDVSGGLCGFIRPGEGYFAPLTQALKKELSIPVILTGGITKAKLAEQLLEEGKADLIGVGRAILGDANWAKNAVESLR